METETHAKRAAASSFTKRGADAWFLISGLLFRIGLGLVTFEEVRPFGVMLSDYCFLISLFLVPKSLLLKTRGSGVLQAGLLILLGAALSLHDSGSLTDASESFVRLFVLFGLIAMLALTHSADIYKNLSFLAGGIFVNCMITLLQASIFPGIVDALSINPPQPDVGFTGRYQGLTEFPVTLGLSAALAVLIGIALFSIEKNRVTRWSLGIMIFVCSVAALLSGSRTFFASLIPGVIVFALSQKKGRGSAIRAALALSILWAAVTYLAPGVVKEFSSRIDTVGLVDYARLAGNAQALLEISQKPILGWGVDHFDEGGIIEIPETGEIAGAHNTFLRYWYAAGMLGAAGFLALFILPIRRMLRILRSKEAGKSIDAIRVVLACSVFFFIVSNLGPYLYNRYLYVPMFVFAGFAAHLLELNRLETKRGRKPDAGIVPALSAQDNPAF